MRNTCSLLSLNHLWAKPTRDWGATAPSFKCHENHCRAIMLHQEMGTRVLSILHTTICSLSLLLNTKFVTYDALKGPWWNVCVICCCRLTPLLYTSSRFFFLWALISKITVALSLCHVTLSQFFALSSSLLLFHLSCLSQFKTSVSPPTSNPYFSSFFFPSFNFSLSLSLSLPRWLGAYSCITDEIMGWKAGPLLCEEDDKDASSDHDE